MQAQHSSFTHKGEGHFSPPPSACAARGNWAEMRGKKFPGTSSSFPFFKGTLHDYPQLFQMGMLFKQWLRCVILKYMSGEKQNILFRILHIFLTH